MLLELAIADAYGAGYEYVSKKIVRENNFVKNYIQHPRHINIKPGQYTDDTQMSLAIAELLVSGERWNEHTIARYFLDVFKRDVREGYARGFYGFLLEVQNEVEFLERIKPESEKSGAAMRSSPIGILSDEKSVIEYATIQARITHNTENGVSSAVAAALMAHYFIYDIDSKSMLPEYLSSRVSGNWLEPWKWKVGPSGMDAVRAALTAIVNCQDLSSVLHQCVEYTGDADTVATIAIAAGACSKELPNNLSSTLYNHIEDGSYGRTYLRDMNDRLFKLKR